ncbi:MAG TPA: nuclear transport factor 2 family protein [Candidatus Eisenbacteria bacterium]|nr:nuclear transport factor 2 family protein [Candidatus Eisenbacteria bacterium]
MRKWHLVIIFVVGCGCLAVAQEKAQLNEDEGKILALENLWNRAEQSKDISALSHIFAPTMVYVDYDGTLKNRDQFLNYVKNGTSSPDQLVSEDLAIHSYGDFAVVTGVFRGKWTKAGKVTQLRGRYVDAWAKLDGVWQCVSAQATLIQPR